ncbi:MAG TPA: hypothetical protein PKK26_05575 [Candidatus Wallbacteria bacterium]|nr:hypothetical protein [Candidatus Wallbacteria bacterium]
MKRNYKYWIAAIILFSCLFTSIFRARCEAAGADLDFYFYDAKYLEKIAEKTPDSFLKLLETALPDAYKALGILKNAASLSKAAETNGAIKSFCVSFTADASIQKVLIYIVFNCEGGRAGVLLEKLSGASPAAGKKFTIAGFTGFSAGQDCAFITNDEKIGNEAALAMAKTIIEDLAAKKGVEEKTVIYNSRLVSQYALEYINANMLSLLDAVYEKVEKFEIEIVNDDNGRVNICFPDEAALLANYEVLVGYKDIFDAMTIGNAEFAKMKKSGLAGSYSPKYSNEMAELFAEMNGLSKKITHKLEGKKLVFMVAELKKYTALNEKFMNMQKKVQSGEAENPVKACLGNMKTIEGATELFMMESPKMDKPVTVDMLVNKGYLRKIPECPESGLYSVECKMKDAAVESFRVKCSRHGYMDEVK